MVNLPPSTVGSAVIKTSLSSDNRRFFMMLSRVTAEAGSALAAYTWQAAQRLPQSD